MQVSAIYVFYARLQKPGVKTIDVVLDVVIWTVNWLHYLNDEAIPHCSSTRY